MSVEGSWLLEGVDQDQYLAGPVVLDGPMCCDDMFEAGRRAAEARLHTASLNVVATAVVRHLAGVVLRDAGPAWVAEVAEMTDDEF